jgi:hypothetical protein
MDTRWFAVDRDGAVGVFTSGEAGAVPAPVAAENRQHDGEAEEAVDALAEGGEPEVDFGGALHPGLLPDQPLPRHRDTVPTVGERLYLFTRSAASLPATVRELPAYRAFRCGELDVVELVGEVTGVKDERFPRWKEAFEALWQVSEPIVAWTARARDVRAARRGLFVYEAHEERNEPEAYGRGLSPARALHVDALPPYLRQRLLAQQRLPVSFRKSRYVQPAEHVECLAWAWGCYVASDGFTVRPLKPKRPEYPYAHGANVMEDKEGFYPRVFDPPLGGVWLESPRGVPHLERYSPVARSLVEGAVALARERGHERVLPLHLLRHAVSHRAVVNALGLIALDVGRLRDEAEAEVEKLRAGAGIAHHSTAMIDLLRRAEWIAEGDGPVRGNDLWSALLDIRARDVTRALQAAGSRANTPLPTIRERPEPAVGEDGTEEVAPSVPAEDVDVSRLGGFARVLLDEAGAVAREHGHAHLEPIHLVLSAVRHPCVAEALDDASADAESLAESAEAAMSELAREATPSPSAALAALLERAEREAGPGTVRGEHLWNALAAEPTGPVVDALEENGFAPGKLRLRFDDPE